MTKKLRVLITVVTVELLLAGLWFHLAQERLLQGGPGAADAQATIGSTIGMAMGAFLGFGCLLMLIAAKNDRAERR
jgi:hypothetical protein